MIQLPFSTLMTFHLQLGNIALHFYGSLDHCGHSVICKITFSMTVQSSNKSANVSTTGEKSYCVYFIGLYVLALTPE